jgi:hypothetical protein
MNRWRDQAVVFLFALCVAAATHGRAWLRAERGAVAPGKTEATE